jgi:hypothetical protein
MPGLPRGEEMSDDVMGAARDEQGNGPSHPIDSSRAAVPSDPVNHPVHYTSNASGIECIEIVEHMNFCLGNAVKYIWRADHKNGLEDLKKARWYLDREIARREKGD